MKPRPRRPYRACCEPLEDRSLLSVITPAQLQHAYGVDAIRFNAGGRIVLGDGAGQTIAVVVADHNPFLVQEVAAFSAAYGLPAANLNQANLAGSLTDRGWAEEEAMDVEWAHAIAPGASILVVEAPSDSVPNLMAAVNFARQVPGVSVVTMSWGSGEFRGQSNYESLFTTPAGHTGVTFVAASGDSGSRSGASWPASSARVVAVGGTTLYTDAAGDNLGEAAWSGSGGGYSRMVARPSYQASLPRNARRATPDVAMLADPATGVGIYVVSPTTGAGYWSVVGGTSLSTQLFGGLVAIADEGRALNGLGSLDGAGQALPALYSAPSAAFQDIASGSSGYPARAGYDLATGRGSPRALTLVASLATFTGVTPARTSFARVRPRAALRTARRAEVPHPASPAATAPRSHPLASRAATPPAHAARALVGRGRPVKILARHGAAGTPGAGLVV